jgi:hypothetical protein
VIAAATTRRAVRHLGKHIETVPSARAAWWIVIAVCAIAVLLLALNGYTGYSIVVGAVGLSAAVNLLPSRIP